MDHWHKRVIVIIAVAAMFVGSRQAHTAKSDGYMCDQINMSVDSDFVCRATDSRPKRPRGVKAGCPVTGPQPPNCYCDRFDGCGDRLGAFSLSQKMTCVPATDIRGPDGQYHQYAPYELVWDGQSTMIVLPVGGGGEGNSIPVKILSKMRVLMQSSGGAQAYKVILDFEGGSAAYSYGRVDKCIVR